MVIFGTTNSLVIDCQWNGEVCDSIISITPVTQPNEAVTISGKPANYISTATSSFALSERVFNYIPSGIFTVFPNLIGFAINNCQTTTLAAKINWNCAQLQNFFISNGIILNIPAGFLQTCVQLTVLHLSGNRIETIDKNAFKGLTGMTTLELSNNNLTCLHADLFQNLPNLRSIYLNNNKIKIINSGTFRNLSSMIYVNFAYNLLQYLPTFDLNGTSTQAYSYITFYSNPINAISPDFTSIYPKRSSLPSVQFSIADIPCLNYPMNNGYYVIDPYNYKDVGRDIQKCHQNWTSSMTDNVLCGQGSVPATTAAPSCPISSFWQQLLDYLKSLKLI